MECAYSFKPDSIYTARELRQVKGVECCLWTEYVPVYSHLQYMLLPRLDAFCEVAWTGGKARSWEEFLSRLKESLPRYDAAGINYARHCLEP